MYKEGMLEAAIHLKQLEMDISDINPKDFAQFNSPLFNLLNGHNLDTMGKLLKDAKFHKDIDTCVLTICKK